MNHAKNAKKMHTEKETCRSRSFGDKNVQLRSNNGKIGLIVSFLLHFTFLADTQFLYLCVALSDAGAPTEKSSLIHRVAL